MFNEPITTIQQAKEFFQAMGCSTFHMDREYPERAKEYRRLRRSALEKEWTQEQFDEYYARIMANTEPNRLWAWHSSMEQLLTSLLYSQAALMKMLEVTEFMRDTVPLADRVLVAETIVGRTVRSARQGLIFLAYDWKDIPAAKSFVELALYFA